MYTEFYNLKEKPFNLSPSSRFLYLGEVHKEALALLTYGVTERKGFTLLTGEVGTGKTTMIHALLANLGNNVQYVHLSNPLFSEKDFMNYLAFSVFKKVSFKSKSAFLIEFEVFLKRCLLHQKNFILIIDEAHRLSFEILEEIRLLSNMETADEKLINIFLVGQPELNEKLSQPQCRALLQRISTRYHIEPLDLQSTEEYITKRLKMAGAEDEQKIFSKVVIKAIHHYSKGYPRMINIIADNALLLGYARGVGKILPSMIKECYEDLQLESSLSKSSTPAESQHTAVREENGPRFSFRWRRAGILISLIAVLSLAIILYRRHFFLQMPVLDPLSQQVSADITSEEGSHANDKIEQPMNDIVKNDDTAEKQVIPVEETSVMEQKEPENVSVVKPDGPENNAKDNDGVPQEATVIVKHGDTLMGLAENVYGRADEKILNMIQKDNPEIEDIDLIEVGQKIVFPALSGMNQGQTFTVHIASYEPFENAQKLFLELLEKGYEAYIIPVHSLPPEKNIFRITLGNFETAQEAEDYAKEIRSKNITDYARVIELQTR